MRFSAVSEPFVYHRRRNLMSVRSVSLVVVAFIAFAIVALAREQQTRTLTSGTSADLIVVGKSKRTLTLFSRGRELKTYRVALGPDPIGHKRQQGDGRTPEGRYTIDSRKRNSSFHRALHVSYPNSADRAAARRRGVSPGGDIMIHGLPNGIGRLGSLQLARDWTLGCIAVTNAEIEEIWRVVPNGTAIEIKP